MNVVYALVAAAGISGFSYSKLSRRTGYGNNQEALKVTGVIFGVSFLVVLILLSVLLHAK